MYPHNMMLFVISWVYAPYNLCLCLIDEGSEDIQVLPNGLALITSVNYGAFCVIREIILLLMSTLTTTITAFSGNTIVGIVDNDDEDQSMNQSISIFISNKQQYKFHYCKIHHHLQQVKNKQ